MRRKRPSTATVIAFVALVVALGGTAVAASRYIITSTSQIKPSVLKQLRREASALAAKVVGKGAKAVVARVRSTGPIATTTTPGEVTVPLSGATWTQHVEELNQFIGDISVTSPGSATCSIKGPYGQPEGKIKILLDGSPIGEANAPNFDFETTGKTGTLPIQFFYWHGTFYPGQEPTSWLFESSKTTGHTLTAQATDSCGRGPEGGHTGGHFTVNSVSIDVVGVR